MSGSPIIQDNKIIGAISTADDRNSLYAYGVYAEDMQIDFDKLLILEDVIE